MIRFDCKCGAGIKVPERFTNDMTTCPHCGQDIRVPASALHKEVVDETVFSNRAKLLTNRSPHITNAWVIVLAVAMLMTIAIPWIAREEPNSDGESIFMSWDVLDTATDEMVIMFVGSWATAGAAILIACFLKGLPMSILRICLGFGGLTLLAVAMISSAEMPIDDEMMGAILKLNWPILAAPLALILIMHLRLRMGAIRSIRIWELILAVAVGALTAAYMVLAVTNYTQAEGDAFPVDLVFECGLNAVVIVACGMMIINGLVSKSKSNILQKVTLIVIYCHMAGYIGWLLYRPASMTGQTLLVLYLVNMVLIISGFTFFFLSGIINMLCDVRKSVLKRKRAIDEAKRSQRDWHRASNFVGVKS
ncbi:MAG TPA: hypothetical protein ENL03_01905 [Phycisphaerae bacterium]|nr:hypothetical protein [Phycisphaerae bacterium]